MAHSAVEAGSAVALVVAGGYRTIGTREVLVTDALPTSATADVNTVAIVTADVTFAVLVVSLEAGHTGYRSGWRTGYRSGWRTGYRSGIWVRVAYGI